jgi:outer membrane protein assembly factor BamB
MSQQMSLERLIADWMADEASRVVPDPLVTQIITTTRRQRPRPRWLASIQESPMHAQARVVVGSPTRRLTFAVALLLLAALIAAGIAGALLLRPEQSGDNWPGFRGGPARIGLATTGPIGNPVTRWRFHAGGAVTHGVSVAGDFALFSSDDGVLHAVGLADGAERWTFQGPAPMNGPLVIDDRVYAADGQGFLHAFDLADGRLLWTSDGTVQGPSELGSLGGRLYVGTEDGFVVAIDASNGTEDWRVAVSPAGQPVKAPATASGILVAATEDLQLAALNPDNGDVRWTAQVGRDTVGTPVIDGDTVYLGASPEPGNGRLVALDLATGTERWRIDENLPSPSIVDGIGYSAGSGGAIVAIDLASGRELWRTPFDGRFRAPAVAGNVVYVTGDSAKLIAGLDRETGGVLWTYDVDGSNQCCIAVARGLVLIGTEVGTVYAVAGDGATLVPQVASGPSARPNPSEAAATPAATVPALDVSVAWATTSPDGGVPWGLTRAPDGRLWAAEGFDNRFAIYTADGAFVEHWGVSGADAGQFKLQRTNGDPYGMVEFAPDGSFYVLDTGNRRVQHFDANRQFLEMWGEFGPGPGQFSDPISLAIDDQGGVYVLDDVRGVIEWYDPHGAVLGSTQAFPSDLQPNDGANQLAIGPGGHFFVSIVRPNVVAELDRDGTLVRVFGAAGEPGAFSEQPNRVAFDSANRSYVTQGFERGDAPGVLVFDADGGYLGGFGAVGTGDADLGFPWGLVVTDDGIYIADASGVGDIGMRSAIRKFEPITFP